MNRHFSKRKHEWPTGKRCSLTIRETHLELMVSVAHSTMRMGQGEQVQLSANRAVFLQKEANWSFHRTQQPQGWVSRPRHEDPCVRKGAVHGCSRPMSHTGREVQTAQMPTDGWINTRVPPHLGASLGLEKERSPDIRYHM